MDAAEAIAPPIVCDPDDPDPRGPACVQSVPDDDAYDAVSIGPTGVAYWPRATKYMVPARDDPELFPALVQNANRYPLHQEFLSDVLLPGLDGKSYAQLVQLRATRDYYAGNLVRIADPAVGPLYGFTVYTAAQAAEQLEPVEVRRVYDQLRAIVTAGALAYTFEPWDAAGPARARSWIDPGFPIWFPDHADVKVEVYTPGTTYGVVRRGTLAQVEAAAAKGLYGYLDLIVVDAVPFDLEAVLAGLVTGGRQWELSHVNVRMARRGTPNLFVADALGVLAAWDGQWVRMDATNGSSGKDTYTIAAATQTEAEAWWSAHRPRLDDVPVPDTAYTELDALTVMDVDDSPVPLVSRFGGKATNLARLYAYLDAQYRVGGFGIPFAHFEAFLDTTTVSDPRDATSPPLTLRSLVKTLAADASLAQDRTRRAVLLAALRKAIETAGTVPPALVSDLAARIIAEFGGTGVRVRFRSSSNVEDGLEFPGAGLYDSTTVCADDSLDADALGPSACDPSNPDERGIERGLRKVWASLYSDRAWDERDWFQVPQDAASMAVLVTQGFPDEDANGVVFTGDPGDPAETRWLVNVQVGDEPVVGNDPSKVPEKDWISVKDGVVLGVQRARSSSLAAPGVPVLTDAQLVELGTVLAGIDAVYPLDLGDHARDEVLLDVEFKVAKGTKQLKLKQIRPFLKAATTL